MTNETPTQTKSTDTEQDWWRGAVIYQIYPRSFQDHNSDGVGDLVGITQRLEYIADLGVDAIWLSPFFTSPMRDFGYDVANYREVDPLFGSLSDFDQLVSKAHKLGLKVVIDQVISHSSDKHPWFEESRQSRDNAKTDWYVWADPKPDGTAPNNWLSVFGGPAWTWDGRRRQYYLHNFLSTQPDLNFHCRDVQDQVLSEMRFWLERGVDGFRLDTVNYYFCDEKLRSNPPVDPEDYSAADAPDVNPYNLQRHLYDKSQPENVVFLERVRALLDEFPGRTSVGEIGDGQRQLDLMADYTGGNKRLHMAYTFDFLGGAFSTEHFRTSIDEVETKSPDGWTCYAFSNHDVVRHVSRWARHGHEKSFACLAAMVLLSMRGSVCLYQGEELGLTEAEIAYEDIVDPYGKQFWPEFKGRDGCRTPMVWQCDAHLGGFTTAEQAWLPVPADHLAHAVDVQEQNAGSVLEFYRAFLRFRKNHPALVKGDITLLPSEEGVLAFTRQTADEKLLCVFCLTEDSQEFVLPKGMSVKGIEAPESVPAPKGSTLTLPCYGAFIGAVT